jgi:tetratricopeptide (TPR) repeat protein
MRFKRLMMVTLMGCGFLFGQPVPDSREDNTAEWMSTRRQGRTALREGRFAEAINLFRNALSATSDNRARAICLTDLAAGFQAQGQWETAEPLLREALTLYAQLKADSYPEYGVALNNLGALLYNRGKLVEAEKLYRQALPLLEQPAANTSDLVSGMINLAALLRSREELGEAESLHKRAIALGEDRLNADDPSLAYAYNDLALIYKAQGRFDLAEKHLLRALQIREKRLGPDHPLLHATLNNLGDLYLAKGDFQAARDILRRALDHCEKHYGADHQFCAGPINNLAQALKAQGETKEAERLLYRAVAIWEKNPDNAAQAGLALQNLAVLYVSDKRRKEALAVIARAIPLIEKGLGTEHPHYATALATEGDILNLEGKYKDAAALYERAYAIRRQALGGRNPALSQDLTNLGQIALQRKNFNEAERLLRQALDLIENQSGFHQQRASALGTLSMVLVRTKRTESAVPLYKKALSEWETALGKDHPDLIPALEYYAALMRSVDEAAEANKAETRALGIRVRQSLRPDRE